MGIRNDKKHKKTHIEQLAKIFGVTPTQLMCFESDFDRTEASKEEQTLEMIHMYFGKDAVQLMRLYNKLNKLGKEKALENIKDLTEHPKYNNID